VSLSGQFKLPDSAAWGALRSDAKGRVSEYLSELSPRTQNSRSEDPPWLLTPINLEVVIRIGYLILARVPVVLVNEANSRCYIDGSPVPPGITKFEVTDVSGQLQD
jgi:hypothetical protein